MVQKGLIAFLGVIGTLVLVNLYFPVLKIHSETFSLGMPLHCWDAFCGGHTIYIGADPNGLFALYYLIYIPVFITMSLLLLPIFYEEVGHTFRKIILIISGINAVLLLIVLIPGITFLLTVNLLNGGVGVLLVNLFLFSLRLFPFIFHLIIFTSFRKKEPLEAGEHYLYPKYYPEPSKKVF